MERDNRFPTYAELKATKSDLRYEDLLRTLEWRKLRGVVLERDNKKCFECGKKATSFDNYKHWRDLTHEELAQYILMAKETENALNKDSSFKFRIAIPIGLQANEPRYLHVHHKYYIFRNLPWEYPLSALTTLCDNCHSQLHMKNIIHVYTDESLTKKIKFTTCFRCSGAGHLPEYKYFKAGICFQCYGARYIESLM